jgi:hypothetical protein
MGGKKERKQLVEAEWVLSQITRMSQVAFEIASIFLLLIANGVFAMAEIAVVSSRKARLRRLADQGNGKARIALELAESPNRFLATHRARVADGLAARRDVQAKRQTHRASDG